MSYQAISDLTYDPAFTARIRACVTEQSVTYQNDQRPDVVALAKDVLRGGASGPFLSFNSMIAAAPGIADSGDADQANVADAEILSAVQANYVTVAGLHYNSDGTPIP
jgi:hypothetical protein